MGVGHVRGLPAAAERVQGLPAAEACRYHLYVSSLPLGPPHAVARVLLGLEDVVSTATVHPLMRDGWHFEPDDARFPSSDPLHGERFLRDLRADPHYTGRVTVPMLWDRHTDTLINNESADIIRMMAKVAPLGTTRPTPRPCRRSTRPWTASTSPSTTGSTSAASRSEAAYRAAHDALFAALDDWEAALEGRTWLCGDVPTLADIALYTTLVRFDPVYYVHFKTSKRHVYSYPNLWGLVRRLHALPGVATPSTSTTSGCTTSPATGSRPAGLRPRGTGHGGPAHG